MPPTRTFGQTIRATRLGFHWSVLVRSNMPKPDPFAGKVIRETRVNLAALTGEVDAAEEKPNLLEAAFEQPGRWWLPIPTYSVANGRDWRKRSRYTQQTRLTAGNATAKAGASVAKIGETMTR